VSCGSIDITAENGRNVVSPFAAARLGPAAAKRFKKVEHATAVI
jgi:hypothetical protein